MLDFDITNLRATFNRAKPFNDKNNQHYKNVRSVIVRCNLDPTLLDKNYETLKAEPCEGEFAEGTYYPKTNTISYRNEDSIDHELFHVASCDRDKANPTQGIMRFNGIKLVGRGLNEGITDMFACMANSNYKAPYMLQKACAEILGFCFGMEIFANYFKNDAKGFNKDLESKGISGFAIADLIETLDEYNDSNEILFANPDKQEAYDDLLEKFEDVLGAMNEIILKSPKKEKAAQRFKSATDIIRMGIGMSAPKVR